MEFTKKSTWKVIMGDFNAKIGSRAQHEDDVMGSFGTGTRNLRGERLIRFCRENRLFITNTMFKKRSIRKWTWMSPDLKTKNEIDFFLTADKSNVLNVSVLNQFDFSSDHRMVRMVLRLKTKFKKFNRKFQRKIIVNQFDTTAILNFNQQIKSSLKQASVVNYDIFQKTIQKAGDIFRTTENQHPVLTIVSKEMIAKREILRKLAQNDLTKKDEYIQVRRETKNMIRKDERNYNLLLIDNAIRNNRGLKVARDGISKKKNQIASMKDENGIEHFDENKILTIATDFYKNLYKSNLHQNEKETIAPDLICEENVIGFSLEEMKFAISTMKNNKACGEDGIPIDLLKICDESVLLKLTEIMNNFLINEKLPEEWNLSKVVLLFKKGKKNEIENYRPISLISHIYKIFCKMILSRIDEILDSNQTQDQAGFRKGFSTSDHLLVVNQVIEKYQEYNKELHIAFIDYSKAFDSIETCFLLKALKEQKIPEKYIRIVKNIYDNCEASISLQKEGEKFKLQRGVKQGDPMSPKLFNAALEFVFRQLKWEKLGLNINGRMLNNLRYADDIVLFSESKDELIKMIHDLKQTSKPLGLKINEDKTKIINNTMSSNYIVDGISIEVVEDFKYLGQIFSFTDRQNKDLDARISAGWRSFWAMKKFLISELPMFHKRRLMDSVILPILTYGAQTWNLSSENERKLQVEQKAMERRILGISRIQHITNEIIRSRTKFKDALLHAKEIKWNFAGHVQRLNDDRWTKLVENWLPVNGKRNRGHQLKRWRDEIEEVGRGRWREKANDRKLWKELRESFVQKWTDNG
jgi:Reverse transcriptase (RNA-dependent DNA polymerase)